ncbi:hypothetical protein ES705_32773 [subsurface metagenome]
MSKALAAVSRKDTLFKLLEAANPQAPFANTRIPTPLSVETL